jgi:uncharacterized protein YbjT (DUF2867 family)
MNDQTSSPRGSALTGKILVTGASGTVGQAVVDALAAAGEAVVAGMRDPRTWIAEGARRASGTAAAQQHSGAGTGSATGRPGSVPVGGKPLRARNQKPERNPAHKPQALPAASAPARTVGRPGPAAAAGPGRPGPAAAAGPGRPGPAAAAGPGRPGTTSAAGHTIGHTATPPAGHTTGQAAGDSPDGRGAEVRAFDFADRGTWTRALAGVDRVFLLVPPTIMDVGRTLIPFIDQAMEESGVQQIVFLSSPGVRLNPRSPHHVVEQYLKRTRTPHTVLRPTVLMQTLSTLYRDDIRLRGEIVLPAGGARVAFVDAADVARAAARVFSETGHLGKVYALAGEQALSYPQVAEILTEVLGRAVRYTATTEAEFADLAAKQGLTPPDIAAQTGWYRAARRRLGGLPNRSIRRLTGRPAGTVRHFVEEHRHTWH